MTIYRDKKNVYWVSSCRFKDANGTPKRTTKRGFKTEEEAKEREQRLKSEANIRALTLSEFFRVYARDIKPTVAASTWENKAILFRDKIEPYLGASLIEELSSQDILLWQDLMRSMRKEDDTCFSPTYLRTINNQLDAILNHAANFYRLERNPMKGLRKMGKKKAKEMSKTAAISFRCCAYCAGQSSNGGVRRSKTGPRSNTDVIRDYGKILGFIEANDVMVRRWDDYAAEHSYAKGISLVDACRTAKEIMTLVTASETPAR